MEVAVEEVADVVVAGVAAAGRGGLCLAPSTPRLYQTLSSRERSGRGCRLLTLVSANPLERHLGVLVFFALDGLNRRRTAWRFRYNARFNALQLGLLPLSLQPQGTENASNTALCGVSGTEFATPHASPANACP